MVLATVYVLTLALAGIVLAGISYMPAETNATVRRGFFILFAIGCVTAVWCTFFLEYQPRPTLRIRGFPLPVAVFELQNGQWIDFVGGPGLFVDLVVIPCLICLPLSLMLIVRGVRSDRAERQRGFPLENSKHVSDTPEYVEPTQR
jgi:hypothetical protein